MGPVDELRASLSDALRRPASLDRAGRFRVVVVAVLGADVLLTLVMMLVGFRPALDVGASFEEGFPSNHLVIRNRGGLVEDVELTVDGRFRATVPSMPNGPTGLEIDRDLRDDTGLTPTREYRPRSVEVRAGRHHTLVEVRP